MNRKQWFVLGYGLILLSLYLFSFTDDFGICSSHEDGDLLVACTIRRYIYGIPAIISVSLGWLFLICGFLEPKKK